MGWNLSSTALCASRYGQRSTSPPARAGMSPLALSMNLLLTLPRPLPSLSQGWINALSRLLVCSSPERRQMSRSCTSKASEGRRAARWVSGRSCPAPRSTCSGPAPARRSCRSSGPGPGGVLVCAVTLYITRCERCFSWPLVGFFVVSGECSGVVSVALVAHGI